MKMIRTGIGEFYARVPAAQFLTIHSIMNSSNGRLLAMSEIEREAILAERLEQMQKIQDRRKLQEMLRQQKGASNDADSVAKAAKRIQFFFFFFCTCVCRRLTRGLRS